MFSDEVWANWGANNRNFVTVQVAGDRDDVIFDRQWGMMNSEKYDEHILSQVEEFIGVEQRLGKSSWYQPDNAPCHKSRLTQSNLQRRMIPTIEWPPYSPDLNLIEHVWVLMKSHVQDNYLRRSYENHTITRPDLKQLI